MFHGAVDDLHKQDPGRWTLASTADLAGRGMTTHSIEASIRRGSLTRLRRGAYVQQLPDDPDERHRLMVMAALGDLSSTTVVSHTSAAVMHGLVVPWSFLDDRVHVTRARGGASSRRRLVSHVGEIPPEHIERREGWRVTSIPWTVVDCARSLGLPAGLAVADSALRNHGADPDLRASLEAVLSAQKGRNGIALARAALAMASPLSESAGESVSRGVLRQLGLPDPVLQYEIRTVEGVFVARTDMAWPDLRTVGEFDGALKYRRATTWQKDPETAVINEKRREAALQELDWVVVRWGWEDLDDPAGLALRIRRAMERGRRLAAARG